MANNSPGRFAVGVGPVFGQICGSVLGRCRSVLCRCSVGFGLVFGQICGFVLVGFGPVVFEDVFFSRRVPREGPECRFPSEAWVWGQIRGEIDLNYS